MSFFAGQYTSVYSLNRHITCRLEARQALIYQLVLDLTGKNDMYNYSKAVHVYPPFFDITCSAKNYKIAPALTVKNSYFFAQYQRIAARRDKNRATIAVAHSILTVIWHILKHNVPYRDLGAGYYDGFHREHKIKAYLKRLQALGWEPEMPAVSA